MEMNFPITTEITVYLTDGKRTCKASGYTVVGRAPTAQDSLDAVAKALDALREQGDEWRLATPQELASQVMEEQTGVRFAVPQLPKEWAGFTEEELQAALEALGIAKGAE